MNRILAHRPRRCRPCLMLALLLLSAAATGAAAESPWEVVLPEVVLAHVPFTLEVVGPPEAAGPVAVVWPGGRETLAGPGGVARVRLAAGDAVTVTVAGAEVRTVRPRVLPGWLSILPAALAIALALITRQVLIALVLGGWFGALVLAGWQPLAAFLDLGDRFLVEALADPDHAAIVLFTTILGGMVGVMSRGGMTEGLVGWLAGRVGGRRGGQTAAAGLGTVIFFDDYANTLLVGTTMRPLTDRLRISREKLAYLVDSTAAPVATLAVISTWVGFEVGLIQDALAALGRDGGSAYGFFLHTLPYSFYPALTLLGVYLIAGTGRDFGPMLAAERRALTTGQLLRPGARPASDTLAAPADAAPVRPLPPLLGFLPVATVILTTAVGLWFNGRQEARLQGFDPSSLRDVLNHADSFAVLMWAALLGALVALVVAVASGRLALRDAMDGFVDGCRAMLIAVAILLLAWTLSGICGRLHTADYLVDVCRGALSPRLLPAVTFVLAAAVSFATGTSWGTMAILMPLVFPLGALLPETSGLAAPTALGVHLAATSAVLAGAVFGDHCSPISDTTIMSSLASGSDHVDHVRTQLPYALAVGSIAILVGYLPAGWGLPPWVGLLLGAALVVALVFGLGRRPVAAEAVAAERTP